MSWLITPGFQKAEPYMLKFPSLYNVTIKEALGADIGEEYQGGYLVGLISHTANSIPTHALIVAPSATGATGTGYTLTTNYALKTTGTSTANTTSSFDGVANTSAMVAAGIASHPAAQFCVNLNIGGYTDWYLPASLELDIAYQALKPTTTSNGTSAGINPYSVPERTSNRTAGNPPQTTVDIFKEGGSQAFVAAFHWSSTEYGDVYAFNRSFSTGSTNNNTNSSKVQTKQVRAFRRIAL